jgi:hypothetical protein
MHLDNLSPIRSIGWFDSLYGAIHNDGSDSVLSYVMQGMLAGASDLLYCGEVALFYPPVTRYFAATQSQRIGLPLAVTKSLAHF